MFDRKFGSIMVEIGVFFFVVNLHGQTSLSESRTNGWSLKTIGSDLAPRTLAVSADTVRLAVPEGESNNTNFLFRSLKGNVQITARVGELPGNRSAAGLMIREGLLENARYAWMSLISDRVSTFERRLEPGQKPFSTVETNTAALRWLRLVREGNAFSSFYANNETNWVPMSADTLEMGNAILAGLAATGSDAGFDHIQMTSAYLASPLETASFVVPTNIVLKAEVVSFGGVPSRVEFFAGTQKIGEATKYPFVTEWRNALAGVQSLTAKITDADGAAFFTEPVNCRIKSPSARAKFARVDDATRGSWKQKYGAEGFYIVSHATNYPAYAVVSSRGHKSILLNYSNEPDALQLQNGSGRIIAQWFTYSNMTVNVNLLDGQFHRVAFYFHDSDSNTRVQQIEVIDSMTGDVLDTQKAANFHSGKYFVWEVRGGVKFRITAVVGNAVINGFFFDSMPH